MSSPTNILSRYYGEAGGYLRDHDSFLHSASIKSDILFLIKALDIKKSDVILDIACGHGRHVNALTEKGYKVDGVDFSQYLLNQAKKGAKELIRGRPNYYKANVEQLKLKKKYNKVYWFFSDLANINISKAIFSIHHNVEMGGKVLFDTDNFFRILSFLQKNPKSKYIFDARKLELIDKKTNLHSQYPVLYMWNEWFVSAGFSIECVLGDYNFSQYSIDSPRLIMIVKKTT